MARKPQTEETLLEQIVEVPTEEVIEEIEETLLEEPEEISETNEDGFQKGQEVNEKDYFKFISEQRNQSKD